MNMLRPRVLARLTNRPLLVTPEKAEMLLGALSARNGLDGTVHLPGRGAVPLASLADGAAAYVDDEDAAERRPYRIVEGVAIVPVQGTLVHKGSWLDAWSGITSYERLAMQIDRAVQDASVRAIALDIDSYGGEVSGCFDLCDRIRDARAEKPVHAILTEVAFSAAYAIASQADRVLVPRTGGCGSIGVVYMHVDWSKHLAEEGIAVTLIHAGAHKVDGNPYAPLPDGVRAEIQAAVETTRDLFAATVAAGRPALGAKAALATEARCYAADDAVAAKLADAVMAPDDAFAALIESLSDGATARPLAASAANSETKEVKMFQKRAARLAAEDDEDKKKKPAPGEDMADEDEDEAAEEEDEEEAEAEAASAHAEGAAAERARIRAILASDEAKGREALARTLALDTDMEAAVARKVLAASPKGPSSRVGGALAAAMADVPNAKVGDGAGAADPADPKAYGRSLVARARELRGKSGKAA